MMDKRTRELSTLARRYGYAVVHHSKHYTLTPVGRRGSRVTASVSPSNPNNWLRNVERDLKRATATRGTSL